jgi:hypothetical protein
MSKVQSNGRAALSALMLCLEREGAVLVASATKRNNLVAVADSSAGLTP